MFRSVGFQQQCCGSGYDVHEKLHHATLGERGSHCQLQQGRHGDNGSNKRQNPSGHHRQHHGGKLSSNSCGHHEYVSGNEVEFKSYSSEANFYPGGTTVRVEEIRYEHHNLGRNMNNNSAKKVEWVVKGI